MIRASGKNGVTEQVDAIGERGKSVTSTGLMEVLERQGFRCALTGRELTPENASLDHIIPFCDGGPNDLDNVHVVIDVANQAKGSMSLDEFIRLCADVTRTAEQAGYGK